MDKHKVQLYLITLAIFISLGISGGLLHIAWTYIHVEFDVKVTAIGVLLMFATTGSLISAFSSGTLIGKYGISRIAVTGCLIMSLGLLSIAFTPAWLLLISIIFIMYIGRGLLDAGLNNFVSANFNSALINWLHASWGIGLTIAPGIVTFIIITQEMSWRFSYILMGGLMLILTGILALSLKAWNANLQRDTPTVAPQVQTASVFETLRHPRVRSIIVLFFVYAAIEIGTGQLANTLFVNSRQIPQETSSFWISLYWASFTAGRLLVGVLALRLSDNHILQFSTPLVLLGTVLLTLPDAGQLTLIGLMLIGLGLAPVFPVLIAQTPKRVGAAHAANAIGLQVGFAGLGASVIPAFIGLGAEMFGLEAISHGLLLTALLFMVLMQVVLRQR